MIDRLIVKTLALNKDKFNYHFLLPFHFHSAPSLPFCLCDTDSIEGEKRALVVWFELSFAVSGSATVEKSASCLCLCVCVCSSLECNSITMIMGSWVCCCERAKEQQTRTLECVSVVCVWASTITVHWSSSSSSSVAHFESIRRLKWWQRAKLKKQQPTAVAK